MSNHVAQLSENRNQFTHSDSASDADEKWPKNHYDVMLPYKVIAIKSFKKVPSSAFFMNFTLQNSITMHRII